MVAGVIAARVIRTLPELFIWRTPVVRVRRSALDWLWTVLLLAFVLGLVGAAVMFVAQLASDVGWIWMVRCLGVSALAVAVYSAVIQIRTLMVPSRAPIAPPDFGGDGPVGAAVPMPSGPPPGLSERGPRQRGPRAEAAAYAVPEGDR